MNIKKETSWNCIGFQFMTGDREEYPKNKLVLFLPWAHYWIYFDKEYIKPFKYDYFNSYSNETYPQYAEREFGITISDGNFLQIKYGKQEGFSNGLSWSNIKENRWSCFLPWKEKKYIYHHFLTLDRKLWCDVTKAYTSWEIKEIQPNKKFEFLDFDGEKITASCTVEQRRWEHGVGFFRWLKYFNKPIISTSLDLHFSAEVGKRKGSWKGGTIGHSIEILDDESVQECFMRYCEKENLTFIGLADE
ncbi:hypothetical protein [Sulfuricurvum sp.]|uniref:hypothetical protein n=1 Tax=Sulfuricurvum sp. TaxID=2025608 RepID=UPI0026189B69|nr:hypothetical protein [Sulfuricurvum sp.]MDD2267627.1 hypothetical protein [Sulfuricurvum sp.]MDD2784239.1 hypothetical protein [Sulfuricurvum sp.]